MVDMKLTLLLWCVVSLSITNVVLVGALIFCLWHFSRKRRRA